MQDSKRDTDVLNSLLDSVGEGEGILLLSSISLHCLLKDAFLSLRSILLNSSFRWNKVEFIFKVPLTCTEAVP